MPPLYPQSLYLASALMRAMWSRGAAAAELATPPLGEEALRPPASCKPHHNSSSEASVSMDQTNSDDDPVSQGCFVMLRVHLGYLTVVRSFIYSSKYGQDGQ